MKAAFMPMALLSMDLISLRIAPMTLARVAMLLTACDHRTIYVDIRIDHIEYEKPILTHEQCMRYTGQYRAVHSIADSFNSNLKMVLGID